MEKDTIIQLLKKYWPEIQEKFGITSLSLFGSIARKEATPNSDVDILVEFHTPPSFDQYMDLKFFLEDHLQRKVDLVTKRGLRSRIFPMIEKDLIRVS